MYDVIYVCVLNLMWIFEFLSIVYYCDIFYVSGIYWRVVVFVIVVGFIFYGVDEVFIFWF